MVYKWYILPIGWLYITYHLLREPETAIVGGFVSTNFTPQKVLFMVSKQPFFSDVFICRPYVANPKNYMKRHHIRWWTKSCTSWYSKYPIIYRVLYIPGGAGFLPPTVSILMASYVSLWWLWSAILKTPTMKWFPSTYLGICLNSLSWVIAKLFRYLKTEVLTSISCR